MYIGITLLFKKLDSSQIEGVTKSLSMNVTKNSFKEDISNIGQQIADYYNYQYWGINDIYKISGDLQIGEILGRVSFYELTTRKKAQSLILKNPLLEFESKNFLLYSLIYFCKDEDSKQFTITILTLVNPKIDNFQRELESKANSVSFKNKIIQMSIDKILSLEFIGIEDIYETDLKFGVYQTMEALLENEDQLNTELLNNEEMLMKIDNIFS